MILWPSSSAILPFVQITERGLLQPRFAYSMKGSSLVQSLSTLSKHGHEPSSEAKDKVFVPFHLENCRTTQRSICSMHTCQSLAVRKICSKYCTRKAEVKADLDYQKANDDFVTTEEHLYMKLRQTLEPIRRGSKFEISKKKKNTW